MKHKVVLLDVDGVLYTSPVYFSDQYADKHKLPREPFMAFFKGDFLQAALGQADLAELITKHHATWQWDGDPEALIAQWIAAEDHPNQELHKVVHELRAAGVPVFGATIQERRRAAWLRERLAPDVLNEMFFSNELGLLKHDPAFFAAVLKRLQALYPGLQPREVAYFDDSPNFVATAAAIGIDAQLYTSVAQVRDHLLAEA